MKFTTLLLILTFLTFIILSILMILSINFRKQEVKKVETILPSYYKEVPKYNNDETFIWDSTLFGLPFNKQVKDVCSVYTFDDYVNMNILEQPRYSSTSSDLYKLNTTLPYCNIDNFPYCTVRRDTSSSILRLKQKCYDNDQIAAEMRKRVCDKDEGCYTRKGKLINKGETEVYAESCSIPKCSGFVTSIAFGFSIGDNTQNYYLSIDLGNLSETTKNNKRSLEGLSWKLIPGKPNYSTKYNINNIVRFRIVRYSYLSETEKNVNQNVNRQVLNDVKATPGTNNTGTGTIETKVLEQGIQSSVTGGGWIYSPTGAFCQIICREKDAYLLLRKNENTKDFEFYLSPTENHKSVDETARWILLPEMQISNKFTGGVDRQRCNYEKDVLLFGVPNNSEKFSDTQVNGSAGNIEYYISRRKSSNIKNGVEESLYTQLTNTPFLFSNDDVEVVLTKETFAINNVTSGNFTFYTKNDTTLKAGDFVTTDNPNTPFFRVNYCNDVSYIALTDGDLSRSIRSQDAINYYPTKVGEQIVDGGVTLLAIDSFVSTPLFGIEYFTKQNLNTYGGYPKNTPTKPLFQSSKMTTLFPYGFDYIDSAKTIPFTNENTKILGLDNDFTQPPGVCPQQLGFIIDDDLFHTTKTIYKDVKDKNFFEVLNVDKIDKKTLVTNIIVPQISEFNYVENFDHYIDAGGTYSATNLDNPDFSKIKTNSTTLIFGRFIPYKYFKLGVFQKDDIFKLGKTNIPMVCFQPNPLETYYLGKYGDVNVNYFTMPYLVNYNRTQFVDYGLENFYDNLDDINKLPSF